MSGSGYAPVITLGTSVLPRRADRRRWWAGLGRPGLGRPGSRRPGSRRPARTQAAAEELPEPVITRLSATEQLLSWTRQDLERVRTAIRELADRGARSAGVHATCEVQLAALRCEVEALRATVSSLLERQPA